MEANRLDDIDYEVYRVFLDLLLERLKQEFGEQTILAVALFGSVARGEARPDSDIDLLVVYEKGGFNPTRKFVSTLFVLRESSEYRELRRKGLKPDPYPVFLTREELWESPLILLDVLDHGIILYDTGILQERLEALKHRLAELGARKVVLEDGRWYWDLKPDWKPGEVIKL